MKIEEEERSERGDSIREEVKLMREEKMPSGEIREEKKIVMESLKIKILGEEN